MTFLGFVEREQKMKSKRYKHTLHPSKPLLHQERYQRQRYTSGVRNHLAIAKRRERVLLAQGTHTDAVRLVETTTFQPEARLLYYKIEMVKHPIHHVQAKEIDKSCCHLMMINFMKTLPTTKGGGNTMFHPFHDKRMLFPTISETIHLSSCSQSAISLPVKESIQSYLTSWTENGMDWIGWMNKVNEAKIAFARLINASPDEIAVLSSVSDAASSFAASLDYIGNRKKVVTTDIDFPCIGHVWLAQERRGAHVSFLTDRNNEIHLEQYEQAIDETTLVTSVPYVSYYNGFIQDVKAISEITRKNGSLLFIDAYQAAGSVPIDVKEMGIDVLATGAQKYLLGVPGICFLYVNKDLANRLYPPTTGWFSRVNPFAFNQRLLDFADGTRRFDTGTPMMIN